MTTGYVTNMVGFRDYTAIRALFDSTMFLTQGQSPLLDVEELARHLNLATKEDTLVIDGSPMIAAAALSLWIEKIGEANIMELRADGSWTYRRISRTSIRRLIEQAYDRGQNG